MNDVNTLQSTPLKEEQKKRVVRFTPLKDQKPQTNEEQKKRVVRFTPLKDQALQQDPSVLNQAGRVAGQLGVGVAENVLFPYEVATAPLASPKAQLSAYRETLLDDLERLQEQKSMGQWDEQDQKQYENIVAQIKDPALSEPFIKTADLGVRSIAEKLTGADLQPRNLVERAANWAGLIKSKEGIKQLLSSGINPKTITKNLLPTQKELARGLGAATGQDLAQALDFGPLGNMALQIVGDYVGGGAPSAIKETGKAITKPREILAKVAAKSVPKEVIDTQKDLIKDFRKAGIQADLGTITDNNLTKVIQARLSASGLVGKDLDNLRNNITKDIKNAYTDIADKLGKQRFDTLAQAGEEGKQYITELRNKDKLIIDDLYSKFREKAKDLEVKPTGVALSINRIEKALKPGELKSPQQETVLNTLDKIKKDIYDESRKIKPVQIKTLLNIKKALGDIIDYEVQGGQKQLLKSLVTEINNAISSIGTKDREALRLFNEAETKFAKHAKTFRNDLTNRILTKDDPSIVMNQMNSIQGIRTLKNALDKSPEGKELFNSLSRLKFDEMIGKKMTDNVSEQIKMGTFSNLLKNPKDRQLVKELLGDQAFKQLENLQKLTGNLSQTANKFFNASKSFTTAIDVAVISKLFSDIPHLIAGNPWSLAATAAGYGSTRYLSKLMGDPKFLKQVEDLILATNNNNVSAMQSLAKELEPAIKAAIEVERNKEKK